MKIARVVEQVKFASRKAMQFLKLEAVRVMLRGWKMSCNFVFLNAKRGQ